MESFKLLLLLASVFYIANFYDVNAQGQAPHCMADVEFVIDRSSSIKKPTNLKLIWKFVKNIVQEYPLTSDGMHVGVITFSKKATVQMPLESRKSTSEFIESFDKNVKDIQPSGNTMTYRALELAEKDMFKKGHRGNVKKNIIFITDGGQSQDASDSSEAESVRKLYKTVDRLRGKGVTIIGFGIGPELTEPNNKKQLKYVTGGNYHIVGDFTTLHKHLKNVSLDCGRTCVDKSFKGSVDVGFLIDSSGKANYFQRELEIVKEIVKAFKIKYNDRRAGLMSYGSTPKTMAMIELGTKATVEEFNQEVDNLKQEGGTRRQDLGRALEEGYKILEGGLVGKKDQKLLFVFSDGKLSKDEGKKALMETENLAKQARIFFIAMGEDEFPYLQLLAKTAGPRALLKPGKKASLEETLEYILPIVCKQPNKKCP